MPKPEKLDQPPNETIRENVHEMGERVKEAGEGLACLFQRIQKRNIHIVPDGSALS